MLSGLAVIGVFMAKADPKILTGQADNRYFSYMSKITEVDSSVTLTGSEVFTIQELIRTPVNNYFSYKGSLTTPPCNPVVQWIVSKDFIRIFPSELTELRSLISSSGDLMISNYRPLQNIGTRIINLNA